MIKYEALRKGLLSMKSNLDNTRYKEYARRDIHYKSKYKDRHQTVNRHQTVILEDDLLEELEQLKYCTHLEENTFQVFQIHLIIQTIVDKHYPKWDDRKIPEMLLESFENENYRYLYLIDNIYNLGKIHGIKQERAKKQKKRERTTILTSMDKQQAEDMINKSVGLTKIPKNEPTEEQSNN